MTPDIDVSDIQSVAPTKHRILYYSHSGRLHIYNIQDSKEEAVPPIRVRPRALVARQPARSRSSVASIVIAKTTLGRLFRETWPMSYLARCFFSIIDTGLLKQLLDLPGFHSSSLSWSPDGQWLAFSRGSPNAQVHKIRNDGSDLQQLTDLDCDAYGVAWSPQ